MIFIFVLSSGYEESVRALIELGANIFAENSNKETPRDLAIKKSEFLSFCQRKLIKIR